MPAELVEDVAGVVGEAGEAVAQGLQRDGQAVVLVLAEAGTDEQGQQFEVITQLDEIQLGLFFQQIDHSNIGHGDLHFFVEESRRARVRPGAGRSDTARSRLGYFPYGSCIHPPPGIETRSPVAIR